MNTIFWMLWSLVVIGTLVFFWFFIVGLNDGSISTFNGLLWAVLVLGLPMMLWLSYWLKTQGWLRLSLFLIAIPALPMSGYLIFIVIVLLSGNTRWN